MFILIVRSCNGGATDGESVKVETATFEENSQTALANNFFRFNISVKMNCKYECDMEYVNSLMFQVANPPAWL